MGAGKIIAGLAAVAIAAEGAFSVTAGASSKLLRPPGIQSEADFMARCIKCGKCVEACPYAALHVAGPLEGAAAAVFARAFAIRWHRLTGQTPPALPPPKQSGG